MFKSSSLIKVLATLSMFVTQMSFATIINYNDCNVMNVKLTSISLIAIVDPTETNKLNQTYDSTSCAGMFSETGNGGANDGPLNNVGNNIGEWGDGLLNGDNIFFADGAFIDNTAASLGGDLQALSSDGIEDDPGWIRVGHFDATSNNGTPTYGTLGADRDDGGLYIGDLLSIDLTCTDLTDCKNMNWTIEAKLGSLLQAREILGEATFDHLAFSIKAGNHVGVYDFNFKEIFAFEELTYGNTDLDFLSPYKLSGTIATNDFGKKCELTETTRECNDNYSGISHMNIYIRDPADLTNVPEPSTIALFGGVLLFMGIRRKRA
ncbi:MAG: PEP-CTERM sorting domain-containing protein [Colwellia sp.]|nr:PEP-CTERM sorting domain-containing protein [Colwellia sp.]